MLGVLLAGLIGYQIHAIFLETHGVPSCVPGSRTRLLDPLGGSAAVAQTMTLESDGFSSIALAARSERVRVEGEVEFELLDVTDTTSRPSPFFRRVEPAAAVAAADEFTVRFPSIAASAGRTYRLEIRMPGTASRQGLALVASRDACYRGGMLLVDEREVWGDLAFRARAETDTVFRAAAWALVHSAMPLRSKGWLIAAWLLYNLALAAFLVGVHRS